MNTVCSKGKTALAVLILTAACAYVSHGQFQKAVQPDPLDELSRPRSTTESVPKVVAMESTIDPKSYIVGPSDIFSVNIWSVPPQNYSLAVSPEGSLIIPTVGEIQVADVSLAEAKDRVLAQIRRRYFAGESSVTLVIPRSVIVTVSGNVLNPGSYTLEANNRIDKAIEEANRVLRHQSQDQLDMLIPTISRRNIIVKHKDGAVGRVDIPRFRDTRDDRWNPYIREGDVVIVPRFGMDRNLIGVYGEVNAPGRFELVEGDSAKNAIQMAYGFTARAMTDSVELTSLSTDATRMTSRWLDGVALLQGRIPNVALSPGDRIVVRARPEPRTDYRVTVKGEVRFPGVYPITKTSTHLSEIITMAGGFTREASLTTSEVVRLSLGPGGVAFERMESLRGGIGSEDSSYYSLETNIRLEKEIVNVDFERLFLQGDSSQDVILQDDDVVQIPGGKGTLYVFGQVASPGHIPFVAGRSVDYYIEKAGGYTDRARKGDVKIVKGKSKQWLKMGETEPEPGDYIWVPQEFERNFAYYMTIFGQTASILSVAASIIILAVQLNK